MVIEEIWEPVRKEGMMETGRMRVRIEKEEMKGMMKMIKMMKKMEMMKMMEMMEMMEIIEMMEEEKMKNNYFP